MKFFGDSSSQSVLPTAHEKRSASVSSSPALKFPLNVSPEPLHPYMELIRLEKPTGTKLMFWPYAWGLTMAAYSSGPTMPLSQYGCQLLQCLVAAFIMRSSACTINDIFDRKMDASVERCKTRPLASGRISVRAASIYLVIQYLLGLAFFCFTLEGLALYVAVFQLLPLFAIYPLLKRVTYWPQAWLGFAMNFGFISAWVSVTNSFDYQILGCALVGCWCWTMLYDTIYACQDIADDLKAGVHSTAILFGTWIRPLLVGCACIFVSGLYFAGCLNNQGLGFFIVSVGGTTLHLVWQFSTVRLDVPESCWTNFNRNGELGWLVWGGLMMDYLVVSGIFARCIDFFR
ncbi:UbiA-domain-containing protein [Hymenopellis radicata]|nr:UbiA-domain-containing protein [Hymenopellis radicata]